MPDVTRSAGPLAVESLAAALPAPSSVPVSSSFLPTWGVRADGFAISRYVCALELPAVALDAVVPLAELPAVAALPVVPVGSLPVVPVVPVVEEALGLLASGDDILASLRMYLGPASDAAAAVVVEPAAPVAPPAVDPAAPAVVDPAVPAAVAPAAPALPLVADAELDGASRRQPVTVTVCRSVLEVFDCCDEVCGDDGVCAAITAVAHAAIAAHKLVRNVFFIRPPAPTRCNRGAAFRPRPNVSTSCAEISESRNRSPA